MNKDLLTIKEVSKIVGVSTQSIYKLVDNHLQPYVVLVGNQKMLKNSVITEYYKQELQPSYQPFATQIDNHLQSVLIETIEILRQQLAVKDKQIEELNERLKEAHLHTQTSQQLQGADKVLQIESKKHWWQRKN